MTVRAARVLRSRIFATTQIACTFVLLAVAGMLVTAVTSLQTANMGYDLRRVLAVDLPNRFADGVDDPAWTAVARHVVQRVSEIPGVEAVAMGESVPWRDRVRERVQFVAEGYQPATGEEAPAGAMRYVSADYFKVLGVPIVAGRGFSEQDRQSKEQLAVISESVARRLFPNGDAVNRLLTPTNLGTNRRSYDPRRIVGVVADVDEEDVVQEPVMMVYTLLRGGGSRLFVRAAGDPLLLKSIVTSTIRDVAADQAVERLNTLEEIRVAVLGPNRLQAFVFSALGGIALLIAVVGVAGVLAFSVSARTREFGVRLAVGSTPGNLRAGVLWDGARTAAIGIAAGAIGGYLVARLAGAFFDRVDLPGALPVTGAAIVLIGAATAASLVPALRASRVDVLQALRSE